jgi:capsular polysaccharide biosynthesis protein
MNNARGVLLRTLLWVLVLVGIVAGLGVAALVGVLEPARYRAEGSLVVERGTQPLVGSHGLIRTIRDLAGSDTVAQDVISTLALHETAAAFRDHVTVTEDDDSAVLLVRADTSDKPRSKEIVVQLGLVLTQLVHERFGQVSPTGGEPIQVAVLDQAHALPGRVSPNVWRNLGWGALFGLVAGLLAANLVATRRPPRLLVETPPVLGEVGSDAGFDRVAGRLLELANEHPFQTILVAGDADGRVATGVAASLAARGITSAWVRAADTDAVGLEGLAARNAFVLVAAPGLDTPFASDADAVLAVTDGSPPPLELILGLRGARLLGAVVAPDREAA